MENSEAFHEVISSSINSLFLNCICTCKDDYSLLKHMWKISHFLHWNSEEKIIANFYTVCVEKFDIGMYPVHSWPESVLVPILKWTWQKRP